jgi:hypothetical protein
MIIADMLREEKSPLPEKKQNSPKETLRETHYATGQKRAFRKLQADRVENKKHTQQEGKRPCSKQASTQTSQFSLNPGATRGA